MKQVTKQEYEKFLNEYPNSLEFDYYRIYEPPVITWNDFTLGDWPKSLVAKYYKDDKKYFIKESK